MHHPPSHHAGAPFLWLAFALFMTGCLAASLRSGKVFFRYRMVERATNPAEFWSACALTAAFAVLGGGLLVLSLPHK
jgi:hypothetical protein